MSELLEVTPDYTARAKSEDGKFYVETTFHDDEALKQNDRIRSSGMLDKGKLGLHEGEDIRMAISVPDVTQWNIFKKKHLQTYLLLNSKDEAERMRGAKQLQILHPEWVVMSRM